MTNSTPEQTLRYHIVRTSYKSSVREAATIYNVSNSLVYKLRRRWKQNGMEGLKPQSRAPKRPFYKVTPRIEALIISLKRKLKGWGATRMKNILNGLGIELSEPTIRKIWKRHGIQPQRRNRFQGFSENIKGGKKNAYWQVDLLCLHFENGPLFYALLAIDTYSRYITCVKVLERATVGNVVNALKIAMAREGKPRAIITDNGTQFCAAQEGHPHAFQTFVTTNRIIHLRIPVRNPQKNGIVERAVQNVKREALRPFINTERSTIQHRLFRWQNWYNFRRKHMGIGNKCPAELFHPYQRRIGLQFLRDALPPDFVGFTM